MAVKVTVYGTANMTQIERARGELDKLEQQAKVNAGGFGGAMARISAAAKSTGESMANVGKTMTTHLTLPIAALGVGLYKATEGAAADAQAQVVLANTLKNAAGATAEQVKSTEDWITSAGKAYGVADDQLRPALATLATATHDVSKAQALANTAMDIAAAKGIPVEAAAKALAKAYAGNGAALGRVLPGLDKAVLKTNDFGKIMSQVNGIVGGQAAKAADTEAGARQRANVALSEAVENLGYAFMPIMKQVTDLLTTKVVPAITKVADWFGHLSDGQKTTIVVIGGIIAVLGPALTILGTLISVVGTVSKVMGVMNAVMAANPILAVVAVIAILVAALITLWNTNEDFRNSVIKAWNAIKTACGAVWDWIVARISDAGKFLTSWFLNWTLPGIIIGHWGEIKSGASKMWDGVVSFFQQAPGRILKAVGNLGNLLYDAGKAVVNGLWNGIKSGWDWLTNSVKSLSTSLLDAAKSALGIHSPSTEFHAVGVNIAEGLANGMKDGTAKTQKSFEDMMASCFPKGKKGDWFTRADSTGTDLGVTLANSLKNQTSKVQQASQQVVEAVTDTLADLASRTKQVFADAAASVDEGLKTLVDDAKGKLDQIKSDMASFASSVSDSITGAINFGQAFTDTEDAKKKAADEGTKFGGSFIATLKDQATKAGEFASKVKDLVKAGLSQDALSQVLAAGANAGSSIAKELLAGGAAAINQANDLVQAAKDAAAAVAALAADAYYAAGVAHAQAELNGYQATLAAAGATASLQAARTVNQSLGGNDDVASRKLMNSLGVNDALTSSLATLATSNTSNSKTVTVAPGAVQVNVSGGDTSLVTSAVQMSFNQLLRELRA